MTASKRITGITILRMIFFLVDLSNIQIICYKNSTVGYDYGGDWILKASINLRGNQCCGSIGHSPAKGQFDTRSQKNA